MKKETIYVTDDGKYFLDEKTCLTYENKQKVPAGVYLFTADMEPITNGSFFENVYRMYIATKEGLEWVRGKCEEFGLNDEGLVIGKHLYDDMDIWVAFEDDIVDYEEKIAKAHKTINQYKI